MVLDATLEIRKLSPGHVDQLADILEFEESWKKLMANIPNLLEKENYVCEIRPTNPAKYNADHFRIITNASCNNKRAEILLDEWGTSGRVRPTLGHLYHLLQKSGLYKAADYVAEILNIEPPARPAKGPAARVAVRFQEQDDIQHVVEAMNYHSSLIQPEISKLDKNINYSTNKKHNKYAIPKIVISESDNIPLAFPIPFAENVAVLNEAPLEELASDEVLPLSSLLENQSEGQLPRWSALGNSDIPYSNVSEVDSEQSMYSSTIDSQSSRSSQFNDEVSTNSVCDIISQQIPVISKLLSSKDDCTLLPSTIDPTFLTNLSELNCPNLSELNLPNLSELNSPKLSELNCPNLSELNRPNLSELNRPNLSELKDPNLSELNCPNLSELNCLNLSEQNSPNLSGLNNERLVDDTSSINDEGTDVSLPKLSALIVEVTSGHLFSHNSKSRQCTSPLPNLSLNTHLPHFSYYEIECATNNFNGILFTKENLPGRFLGLGAFGSVYLAVGLYEKPVAVKKISLGNVQVVNIDDTVTKQFRNEVEVLSRFKHDNLVSLLGYSCDGCTYCLIYDYISGGTLKDRLQKENEMLNWQERLHIALCTAKAVSYLHTAFSTPLIHRDIKSANILLDCSNNPKLCDFGITKLLNNQNTTTVIGTSAYMAPEAIRGDISVQLDTFSFGVVLLELLTSLPPLDDAREERDLVTHVEELWEKDIVLLDTKVGTWKSNGTDFGTELFAIAKQCICDKKKNRPNMVQVTSLITTLKGKLKKEEAT